MITRRRIICFILNSLLSSCALFAPKPPERTVRVKALADVSFRARNPRWPEEVRGRIEAASDYYEREFGIRFVTQSTEAWPAQERVRSTPYFTAGRARVDRIGNCQQGLGNYVIAPVNESFHYMGPYADPKLDVIALIHELAHIFGAEHVDDRASIMHEDLGYRTEFDDKNRSVVEKNKLCPFAKG